MFIHLNYGFPRSFAGKIWLDHCTICIPQTICGGILAAQKSSCEGDTVTLSGGVMQSYTIVKKLTVADMRRLRKQFLIFLRANPVKGLSDVPKNFISYLTNSIST